MIITSPDLLIPKKQLYVGCGLTHAPEEFKAQVEETKLRLGDEWDVMQFLGLVAGTAADVYEQDILTNVHGCDAFTAICDEPSLGLGYETDRAVMLGKPVLMLAHEDTRLTRLFEGAPVFEKNCELRTYENMVEDVPGIVREVFATVLGRTALGEA
jgi:hypothetical protein